MSVIGAYESIANHDWFTKEILWLPPILQQEQQEQGEPMVTITVEQQTSLLAHIGAGLCSGVAQSIVMTGWEYLNTRDIYKHFGPRAVHPTIGYASLFGS